MNKWFWIVIILVVFVVAGLMLYTGPEEKSEMAYKQALAVERTTGGDQAVILYDQIIADYPDTEGAALAAKGKVRIVSQRDQALKKEMQDQIGRILLVLNGYQSMMGRLPASIADLDEGEYFFDSDYLAEVVPEGYTTYLVLSADAPPRIWPISADKEDVFVSIDRNGSLQKMSKVDALQEITDAYTEVTKKGQMVFLQVK